MQTEKLQHLITHALDEMKAFNIQTFDVRKITTITDVMVIASGNSDRHTRALANHCLRTAKAQHVTALGSEGEEHGDWILIDFGNVVIHIMQPATRDYYHLEKLWSIPAVREQPA